MRFCLIVPILRISVMVKREAHNLETVIACPGSNPGSATKNTKYFHKYLDISNFFVIFVLLKFFDKSFLI